MIISAPNLAFFLTSLDQTWWTANRVTEAWNAKVSRVYPVAGEQWVEAWIEMLPKYREWLGPRFTQNVKPRTYLVPVKNWELTIELDQFRLEDSSAQMAVSYYAPTVSFMGLQAKKLWDYQLRDLLESTGAYPTGSAWQLGPDGLTYWNTAHPVDPYDATKGTYSNDYRGNTGTAASPGGPFGTQSFNTAWEDMATRKNESGERFGIMPDLSMFPLQIRAAAMTVLQSQFFAPPQMGVMGSGSGGNAPFVGAMDNPLRGWTDMMINPDLMSATQWYMLLTSAPVKPFGILLRAAPDLIPRVTPNDPVVFNEHKYLYGSRARGTPNWGLPWLGSISG
jgi:phage major head subunit gpT-like protein